jgi:hypothetical protein
MARGGSRPGAGRPPGARDKLALDAAEAAEAEGIMPREFLLGLVRDVTQPLDIRMEAAKAAAPYYHPKRAPENGDGEEAAGVTVIINKGCE